MLTSTTLEINKNLIIDGSTLEVPITIDGGGDKLIFRIYPGVLATLDSLIIQHGFGYDYGGGIFVSLNANLTVSNTTLFSNSSTINGGGIYNTGTLTVMNSTISFNSASHGGGIYNNSNGVTSIINSTIVENDGYLGGGIFNYSLGLLSVTNSTFSRNIATQGGGIFNYDLNANIVVTNSTFFGNTADDSGGGIYNTFFLSVTNSTFSANTAVNYGGGIFDDSNATLSLVNSTFSNNSADKADGIYNDVNGTFNYVNTIIANFMDGGDCVNDGVIETNIKNMVADGSCASEFSEDPLLGPLADNGGQTQTHALLIGSPAIDTGDNTSCPATDQRGLPRPQGAGCDIGSYEFAIFIYLPIILK